MQHLQKRQIEQSFGVLTKTFTSFAAGSQTPPDKMRQDLRDQGQLHFAVRCELSLSEKGHQRSQGTKIKSGRTPFDTSKTEYFA